MPISILMPALSPTMETGKIAKWHVAVGDAISPGDIIVEVETDKATMEVEAVDEGRIGKIVTPEGDAEVPVNQLIAVVLGEGEDDSDIEGAVMAPVVPIAQPESEAPEGGPKLSAAIGPSAGAPTAVQNGARILASPLAKRMAAQNNLSLGALTGSGPKGRIIKRDIEAALESGAAAPSAAVQSVPATGQKRLGGLPDARLYFEPESYTEQPHDNLRKTIAARLTLAKSELPHFRVTIDCEIDNLLAARRDLNARSPEGDGAYKISVNDFIIRALAMSLKRTPSANASWTDDAMLLHKQVDIGVAVAIEGGLITPIVRSANEKGLAVISTEMADLAARARTKKLKPNEFEGGTFAVSNLGMFGVDHFDAVINPPHAGILAVGRGAKRPVVKDDVLSVATMMTVTLSCDHRVIDGALGAQLLQAFKGFIEDPVTMLL